MAVLGILVLLVLLAGWGYFVYLRPRPGAASAPPPPAGPGTADPAAEAPVDLQPPVLAGDVAAGGGQTVATVQSSERTVKVKRAADLAWEDAKVDMTLFESDSLRTFDHASATIAFGPDDIVEVGQNALVIIKPQALKADEISLAVLSADLLDGLESRPAP